jgi:hypothetical protein
MLTNHLALTFTATAPTHPNRPPPIAGPLSDIGVAFQQRLVPEGMRSRVLGGLGKLYLPPGILTSRGDKNKQSTQRPHRWHGNTWNFHDPGGRIFRGHHSIITGASRYNACAHHDILRGWKHHTR